MNITLVQALLTCVLVLPTGCKEAASNGGESGPSQSSAGTPQSASEQSAMKEAQAFLDGGGDVNAKDSLGTTRLTDAVLNDYGAVVVLLASKGADVNAADDVLGQTALHFCAAGDNARAAAALIQKGANVNARDRRGKTPLHEAAAAGAIELTKLLLSNKADVKARDNAGKTPIDRAARARQEQIVALLLASGSEPAHELAIPKPVTTKSDAAVAKDEVPAPATPIPPPPPPPPPAIAKVATETTPAAPSPEIAAAGDLAEMVLWWETQPWVKALKKSMPRGVTILMHAEPYDAGGWSEVELRENHAPGSGFDPDVSPIVGFFRVSRAGKIIEWMEPVSGEYEPLAGFLKTRGLKLVESTATKSPSAGVLSITAGDFESKPPAIPNRDAAVVVTDPTDAKNHVARVTGPDEMGFTLPISVPSGTKELTIALRLLHPEGTKLIRFEDGQTPEGIRLRVRLLNDLGNSIIRDAVVRPTGQWRELEFTFYDLPKKVVSISVEAIWMEGPVYFDDVRLTPAKP